MSSRTRLPHPRSQNGFTIIEVMVAAMLLLVGMLGLLAMVERSTGSTAESKLREGATNLAREVVEQARAVPYNQISAAALPGMVQAAPGLASTTSGQWTVSRRGFTYRVTTSVCAIDDPRDGLGDHSGGGFCPGPAGTDDGGPQDFKQVSADVQWTVRGTTKTVRRTALLTTHGTADAAVVRSLVAVTPTFPAPARPVVTSPGASTVTFELEASTSATRIIWSLDGVDKSPAPTKVGDKWRFTLSIPASTTTMSDGDYEVGARAVDTTGAEGPTFVIPLRLLRTVPGAPANLVIGNNRVREQNVVRDAVELEWRLNPERNVRGYRVYRGDDSLACPRNPNAIEKVPACVDTAPSYGTYKVKPVFENASGALVDGPNFATATVSTPDFDARIFRMHGPSGGGGTNCPNGGAVFPMAGTYVPGATTTTSTIGGAGTRFCSSTTEPAARTQGPGEIRAEIWMRNTDATTCSLTATLGFNAVAAKSVTVTATVPPNSYGPIRWSAQHSGFAVAAGDRAVAQFSADSQAQCAATTFNFGATATPSTLRLGGADALPAAPTGLTATPSASGLVLSWTAAADAQADWSYRIYRAGREHTQRIDRTADASTQHVVPDNTGSDQYWVTAVSPRLGESTHLGPVTG